MLQKYRQSGFTLAEILMVVVILAIAAAIIVPAMADTEEFILNSAAIDLNNALTYAQTQSIATGKIHRVVFSSDDQTVTIQIQNNDLSYGTIKHPITKQDYQMSFGEPSYAGIAMENIDFDAGDYLLYDGMARPYSDVGVDLADGSVELTGKELSRKITVQPVTGKITIE
ncbi:MAG: prepilin-type N-terminal cleavage/methylation domain-containing protein [Phycisphaerae bacterium]|nr:prepilin-type N-terminal cleavage/methylation domain-containing protein [Phycisphaerae bacterium]